MNASSTALKSRLEELDKAPETFSQSANFGYSSFVASCISLMILMASRKRPLCSPARPSRLPDATLRSWQGEPKVMMSPKCSMSGKCFFVTETHSIRRVVLKEIVLRNLREAISYVTQYEDDFIQRAVEQSLRARDKALAQSEKRIVELDVIFKRIYEDNISGKLSRGYEQEQLKAIVETLEREVKQQEQKKANVRKFISAVNKYTDMTQLDATILREFVEQIRVSDTYTSDEQQKRVKIREIEIVYNFMGAFDFEEAREQS